MQALLKNPSAFTPMYDTVVGVDGVRSGKTLRGQFRACVFDVGLCDPLAETDGSSSRGVVRILVPRCGEGAWISGRPQVGDRVQIADDGRTFKVSHVSLPMGDDWDMEAREA